jgi:hypothetical protein
MRARVWLALLIAIAGGASPPAVAHEIRPAFLQIREIEPSTYDILWKTPAQGDMRLALNIELPPDCRDFGQARTTPVNAAVIQHWRSQCNGGLAGKTVVIANLETSLTDVILRFEPLSGRPRTLRIQGAEPRAVIPARQSPVELAQIYFRLGVEHILSGVDHLLFLLCLLMLVRHFKRLIGAVTAFTVAHSITLAGTTFGWWQPASLPVEACIALSIAFLAAEVIRARAGTTGLTQRWPWIAAFGFGLLHGFGFAAALREIGLPDEAVWKALLFFNLGVEVGQVVFIGMVLAAVWSWRRFLTATLPNWAWRLPAYAAGVVACFWFIERSMRIFV